MLKSQMTLLFHSLHRSVYSSPLFFKVSDTTLHIIGAKEDVCVRLLKEFVQVLILNNMSSDLLAGLKPSYGTNFSLKKLQRMLLEF